MVKKRKEDPKLGVPGWMVSFGDMMTLILTFFILLVSMSYERNAGLVAAGLGSFAIRVQSFGLDSVLTKSKKQEIFNEYRRRFNLPPEEDPDRRADHEDAADQELVRAAITKALKPHDSLNQPRIAVFREGSAVLEDTAKKYVDRLADTLRPVGPQVLVLEGHAVDSSPDFGNISTRLAYARAKAVAAFLIEEHGFSPDRVETRAWLEEMSGTQARQVDARLITPAHTPRD